MLNISSKTKSHILVLIFGPHVPLWLPSIVTLHIYMYMYGWMGLGLKNTNLALFYVG